MVALISRDDDKGDIGDDKNGDIGDDHGGDDDSAFQRSAGIKRKRHEQNPGTNTDRNEKTAKISTDSIASDGDIHKNVPQGPAKPSSWYSIVWEIRRQELADFKRKLRHTNVPRTYAENKPFGIWVMNQRKQYKLFKEKRKSFMTRERIQSLEELDFDWEPRTNNWEGKCQQLADFKVKYSHTNVPQKYAENNPLGIWVMNQRQQYRLFKEKRKSSMTRERIQSLDKLDFEWQPKARPNSSSLMIEKSLLSTEDGYESDNSELYLII